MPAVRWDVDAKADLANIWEYIATDSPAVADRVVDKIRETARLIATQPNIGQSRPELAPDLRSFSVRNYILFFRSCQGRIEVARVLHAARDIDAQF